MKNGHVPVLVADEKNPGKTRFLVPGEIKELNQWYSQNRNKPQILTKKIDL